MPAEDYLLAFAIAADKSLDIARGKRESVLALGVAAVGDSGLVWNEEAVFLLQLRDHVAKDVRGLREAVCEDEYGTIRRPDAGGVRIEVEVRAFGGAVPVGFEAFKARELAFLLDEGRDGTFGSFGESHDEARC